MLGSNLLIAIVELDLLMWKLPHSAKQGAQKKDKEKQATPKKRKRKHLFLLIPHVDYWLDRIILKVSF